MNENEKKLAGNLGNPDGPLTLAVAGSGAKKSPRKENLPAWLVKPYGSMACSIAELSDEELYKKCRECGQSAKVWLRRFAALLPEVSKRGLHRRKGFLSIHVFAAMIAGMSEYMVDRILQLYAKIRDKPALLKLFESGSVGWSKIEVVAYIATLETDKLWAEKVGMLSVAALSELVKNYRLKSPDVGELQNKNLFGLDSGQAGMSAWSGGAFEPPVRFSFPASREVEFDLRLAKQRLEKQSKQSLSWNETFQKIIEQSELAKSKILPPKITKEQEICVRCAKKKNVLRICEECSRKPARDDEAKDNRRISTE